MSLTKKILIAEEFAIFRAALKMLIASNPAYNVVGEASDGLEAIRLADFHQADLVTVELSMPKMGGISVILEIKKRDPSTKILVITGQRTEEHVRIALKAGADGYVLKDSTHDELMLAIESIFLGKRYISPAISGKVIEGYLEGKKDLRPSTALDMLTRREREVLKLIGEGYKNKDIADHLCISSKTVEKHRANIMKKLDLHNVSLLTAFAHEIGMIAA